MSIKVILSLLQGTDSDAPVLGCAEFLAKNCLAHVSVLHLRPDPRTLVPYVGDGMSGALVEQILTSAERDGNERAAKARASFETWRVNADLPIAVGNPDGDKATCTWLEMVGQREQIVAHHGRTQTRESSRGFPTAYDPTVRQDNESYAEAVC